MEMITIDAKALGLKKMKAIPIVECFIGVDEEITICGRAETDMTLLKLLCGDSTEKTKDKISELIKKYKIADFLAETAKVIFEGMEEK